MRVAPSEVNIYVCYNCPSCDWPQWFMPRQYEHRDFKVFCDCGESFAVEPFNPSGKPAPKSQPAATKADNEFVKNAAEILAFQGFKKDEILAAIKTSDLQGKSLNQTIAEIIRNI